ncbi:RDD family protein [Saccharopolyspora shandongensis]|uniref:RDD family protein n=1 Tax=Saccharopolyspora shandongensis TaxID=418495 RepID=UPI0034284B78
MDSALFVITFGVGWIVWTLIVWARGTTPAKQLMRMTVIWTADRRAASWGRMFLRGFVGYGLIVTVISVLTAGIGEIVAICMIFGDTRQTLWDRLASTFVVDGYRDVEPEALPPPPEFDQASHLRRDRTLAIGGAGAGVVLILAAVLIVPTLAGLIHPNPVSSHAESSTPNQQAGIPGPAPSRSSAVTVVQRVNAHPAAKSVAAVLERYFTSINQGDADTAWDLYTASQHARIGDKAGWARALQHTRDTDAVVYDIDEAADHTVYAWVTFTSRQSAEFGPNGDTCDLWDLRYALVPSGAGYLIEKAVGVGGTNGHTTC